MSTASMLETRAIQADSRLELRDEGGKLKIRGYAAVFNKLSVEMWGMRELVKPGAFARFLRSDPDILALVQHDPGKVIGRTKAGTARVWEDDFGLGFECDPPDTTVGHDTIELLRRGDVDGASIGFTMEEGGKGESWIGTEDGGLIRKIHTVETVPEFSIVSFPAYPDTSAEVRSRWTIRQEEALTPKPADFQATPFADLPIVDEEWNPNDDSDADIIAEILGEEGNNWEAMKRANLAFAPGGGRGDPPGLIGAYKLKIARRRDGVLTVFFQQLASRLAIINGARGGVDMPRDEKEKAFRHGLRYYDKLDIPEEDRPEFRSLRRMRLELAERA